MLREVEAVYVLMTLRCNAVMFFKECFSSSVSVLSGFCVGSVEVLYRFCIGSV